jgi:hypothetical protein
LFLQCRYLRAFTGKGRGHAQPEGAGHPVPLQEVLAMEPAILAICGVIAAVWAISKTASAVRMLRQQRRDSSDGLARESGNGGYAAGGIDPGGSDCPGGHGGGDCGGHGGGW